MLVNIKTYLTAIFNSFLNYRNLIKIDSRSGMMTYKFRTQTINIILPINPMSPYLNYAPTNEYVMLMNKELGTKININDVIFTNVERLTMKSDLNSHIINNSPIKVKDLLVALYSVISPTDVSYIEVDNIHEIPYTNELILSIYAGR